jgi:hypothetical protein
MHFIIASQVWLVSIVNYNAPKRSDQDDCYFCDFSQ